MQNLERKQQLVARLEEFYNQCHQETGANGGRFCDTEGGDDSEGGVSTNKVGAAFSALASGKNVHLEQKKDLRKLVDQIGKNSKAANAPVFNLCKVSVQGQSGFCAGTKGIPRADMPQLKTYNPTPGSKAAALQKNGKGQVDIGPAFLASLKAKGIKVTSGNTSPDKLHATQDEINGARVAEVLAKGGKVNGTIYVSREGYILDGHHHWAAAKVQGSSDLNVIKIDMPINELLKYTNDFSKDYGVPHKAIGE